MSVQSNSIKDNTNILRIMEITTHFIAILVIYSTGRISDKMEGGGGGGRKQIRAALLKSTMYFFLLENTVKQFRDFKLLFTLYFVHSVFQNHFVSLRLKNKYIRNNKDITFGEERSCLQDFLLINTRYSEA